VGNLCIYSLIEIVREVMDDREIEKVEIVDYDESWPEAFERERETLISAVGEYITGGIEHVGSTSVQGLAAKPIVDIQVGVSGLDESRPAFGSLEAIGYSHDSVCSHVMHFFDKRTPGTQPYNLQLIPFRSDCWNMRIAFRDYLRSHHNVAQEYAALKRELARRFSFDRNAYGAAKSSFICHVVKQALSSPDGDPEKAI
jgi:GrpB-like predicted nucleotidyltransferase (UPF0157 family)